MQPINKLSEIPNKKYQGYVWCSNEEEPKVLKDEEYKFQDEPVNPFVVEALLYCKDDNTSIIVKHTGRYLFYQFDLNNLPDNAMVEEKTYLPHRLNSVSKVHFQQLWLAEEDPNCENMEVLTLKAIIFSGFDKQKKS